MKVIKNVWKWVKNTFFGKLVKCVWNWFKNTFYEIEPIYNNEKLLDIKKHHLEVSKFIFTIVFAVVGAGITFWQVNAQLDTQNDLKQKEFNAQRDLETKKFESELLLKVLTETDSLSNDTTLSSKLFKKLVSTGFLNDNKKRYSFLLYDTVHIRMPRKIERADSVKPRSKPLNTWLDGHVKNFCDRAEGTNFKATIYSNGIVNFSFDIESQQSLSSVIPKLIFRRKGLCFCMILPAISIPAYQKKRIVFEAYDDRIKNIDIIYRIDTDWDCNEYN